MIKPNPPTVSPATEPNAQPKSKNWLLVGVFVLLIVSLLTTGFLAYQNFQLKKQVQQVQITPVPATPTPDPTADWKTFSNKENGYSIKYPTAWFLNPDKQAPDEIMNLVKDLYSLTIYSGSSHTEIPPGKVPSQVRSITIGGKESKKEVYEDLFEIITLPKGLSINQISIRYRDGIYSEEYSIVFNQILSTFKFLD